MKVSSGNDPQMPVEISVVDDGEGMDADTLGAALTFGGSSRFNDRSSLGRYGMGLPNGTLSRSRRVEVYTWRGRRGPAQRAGPGQDHGRGGGRPAVRGARRPPVPVPAASGTAVRLLACDRVEYRRPSALARKLEEELGRIYRHFLAGGPSADGKREAGRPVRPAVPAAGIELDRGTAIRRHSLLPHSSGLPGKARSLSDSASFPSINGMTSPLLKRRRAG